MKILMNHEALKTLIVEAIQREHGYSQHGIDDTVMAVIEPHLMPQTEGGE